MKIKKLRIQNFKAFKDRVIDFNSSDLVIFDGPNGFGKTTIYDAIELLFTGKIRRYDDLKVKLIDGRQSFDENPFYHDHADGENVVISIELEKNDKMYYFERVAIATEIKNEIDFSIYRLYEKDSFDSLDNKIIESEKNYLNNLLGVNYDSNFQFLNYIEQEECLFLLKNTDKSRKSYISHLFDLKEFVTKIKRIDDLKSKMDLLCDGNKQNEISILKTDIELLKENLKSDFRSAEHIKLFGSLDLDWDKEDLDIKTIDFDNIVSEDGVLENLKKLISQKEIFRQYRINVAVDLILDDSEHLNHFIKYFDFISKKEELRIKRDKFNSLHKILNQLKEVKNSNIESTIELEGFSFIPTELKELFKNTKSLLNQSLKEQSDLEKVYSGLIDSRNQLKENIQILKGQTEVSGECLLCGFDWGNIDLLLQNIEKKTLDLQEVTSDKNKEFERGLVVFKNGVIKQIIELILINIDELRFDEKFVQVV